MQLVRNLASKFSLVSVLGVIFTLNITRSSAILFFSWTVLQSSENMLPFAFMLLVGELISMTLSTSAGTLIANHGAARSFLLGEVLFVIALGWYFLVTLRTGSPALSHPVFSYGLMSLASVISYPSSQTLLRLASTNGYGTRNASLSNISSTSAYVIGPVLIGGLLTWSGALYVISTCLFFAFISIGLALLIRTTKPTVAAAVLIQTRASDHGIISKPIPLIVMISIIYSAFTFLATYLAPLAIFQLKADASGLGLLRSAWSIGAIVGTIAIALSASRKEPRFPFLIVSAILWALTLSSISFSTSIPIALGALLAAGLLFALTRSSFDGLLLRISTTSEYPKLKTRTQAGASVISICWILLAIYLPPLKIGYAFLVLASLVISGALLFLFTSTHAAKTFQKSDRKNRGYR